jgi:hypothetical protein
MLCTANQAHQYLGGAIGINKVRTLMATGVIPSKFDGKKYITTQKQLDKYVQKENAEMEIMASKINHK